MNDRHAAPRRGAAAPEVSAAWDLRLARAVPFALVCSLFAAAGHTLVGDGDVELPALALGFGAVCILAALFAGRERSWAAICGALGTGQLGLHLLFHGMSPHPGMTGRDGVTQLAGRLLCNDSPHHGLTVVPADPMQLVSAAGIDPNAYTTASPQAAGLLGLTPAMLLGHLAAALLAGWWLRRGEAALWRLVRVAGATAREWAAPLRTAFALLTAVLLGPPAGERTGGRRVRAADWRLPVAAALRHSMVRRGPPVAAFAR